MKKRLLFSLIFACSLFIHAQETKDPIAYYLFPEFTDGIVVLKSGKQVKTKLNYHTLFEEMQFEDQGKRQNFTDTKILDTIIIANRKFIPFNSIMLELMIDDEVSLYIQHKGKLLPPAKRTAYGGRTETTAVEQRKSMLINGVTYDLELPNDFKVSANQTFWIKQDGKFVKINSLKKIKKIFPGKADFIKSYNDKFGVNFNDAREIIQLIYYCNQ